MNFRPCFLLLGTLCLGGFSTGALAGTVTLDLTSATPMDPRYAGHAGTSTFGPDVAGVQNFTVSAQAGNPFTLPAQLQLFCIELAQNIYLNSTGNFFTVTNASQGSSGGPYSPLGANIPNAGIGAARADNLAVLYAHKFGSAYDPGALSDTEKLGFQLAVWELSHDDDFNLLGGSGNGFWVTAPLDAATTEAQTLVSWVQVNAATAPKMQLYALHSDTIQDFLVPIPEPSAYAAMAGLLALGAAGRMRRKSTSG